MPPTVDTILAEEALALNERTFRAFRERAFAIQHGVLSYVAGYRPLYAYGAAAKGNTLLNFCGITTHDILAVGDTTPAKVGKFLPGSRIPIISEAQLIERQPGNVLILPWNWKTEIIAKLAPKLPNTRFVTAMDLG